MKLPLTITQPRDWLPVNNNPIIIAGPCSAESEEQIFQTAQYISALKRVNIFRAGVWKARSTPDCYEGAGVIALQWLKRVKSEFGMLTAVEVGSPYHVEECLNAKIDILWLGARTTVNPFVVQAIADSLKGVDIPVLVKNPISPDLDLWIGALKRLNLSGITKLIAIHRGFSSVDKTRFRNSPEWNIPKELKRIYRDIPIICDPSHIAGNRDYIPEVVQTAMGMDFDGLMIETHNDPENALSDSEQQVTPKELGALLDQLAIQKMGPILQPAPHK